MVNPRIVETMTPEEYVVYLRDILHEVGVALDLREGFDYDEIVPAIKAIRAGSQGCEKNPM